MGAILSILLILALPCSIVWAVMWAIVQGVEYLFSPEYAVHQEAKRKHQQRPGMGIVDRHGLVRNGYGHIKGNVNNHY